MDDELISIGEAAHILGLAVTTLRRWDENQRGPRPIRSASGQRRYRRREVLQEAGLSKSEPTDGTAARTGDRVRHEG